MLKTQAPEIEAFSSQMVERVDSLLDARRAEILHIDTLRSSLDDLGEGIESCTKVAAIVLSGAGPRIGEALGLHVSDVHFLRRTVSIERQRRQDALSAL